MMILLYLIFAITIIMLLATLVVFSGIIAFAYVRVPYLPAPKKAVEKMFQLAQIKPNERVYDLGCGNGYLLFKAEKECQARSFGYEISPWPYTLAIIRKIFGKYKSKIYLKNFLKQNLSNADVIFCYLMPGANEKLCRKIDKELSKKTRIVTLGFDFVNLKNFKLTKKELYKKKPVYLYEARSKKYEL